MPELNTPYRIGNTINGNTVNGDMVEVIDCNGFYVLDCFKVDADEIIKRVNKGHIEQQLIDDIAVFIKAHIKGTRYDWVPQSLFDSVVNEISNHIKASKPQILRGYQPKLEFKPSNPPGDE